jgi:hypothetical protein
VAVTASAAALVVAVLVAGALTASFDVTGSPEPPCTASGMSMEETVSRMFALMSTDAGRMARCWTPGEAELAVLGTYAAAGAPASYAIEVEQSGGRDGVLFAAVRVSASWAGSAPPGWSRSQPQIIVMRQHRDWSWTIDTIQPRNREGRSDPHCGVCHR